MKKVLSVLLTVIMLAAVFTVAVSAEGGDYPSPSGYWNVVAVVKDDKGGTANADPATVPYGDTSKITAKADEGYEFVGWTFEGEFEWVEGDANSLVVVIRPKSDVKFIAEFKGEGGKKDDDHTSPGTGYNMSAAVAVMAVVLTIGAASVVVTGRRYFCGK